MCIVSTYTMLLGRRGDIQISQLNIFLLLLEKWDGMIFQHGTCDVHVAY